MSREGFEQPLVYAFGLHHHQPACCSSRGETCARRLFHRKVSASSFLHGALLFGKESVGAFSALFRKFLVSHYFCEGRGAVVIDRGRCMGVLGAGGGAVLDGERLHATHPFSDL